MNAIGQKATASEPNDASPLSVRGELAGRHMLVTGVTGFLAKVWVALLLETVPDLRLTIVVRGKRGSRARDRFEKVAASSPAFRRLRAKHGQTLFDLLDARVRVIEGDVGAPLFGLSEPAARYMASGIDLVAHFAGMTDFEPDPTLALGSNVLGAKHAADVAALTPSRRLLHVSTTFVAGNVSGAIPETITPGVSPIGLPLDVTHEIDALRALADASHTKSERIAAANARLHALGYPNIYTYTKSLAEHLLAARSDIDLAIARPSVVEGARSFPFPGWNEGINTSGPLVWLLASTFRKFPSNPKHRFDVVPVDTVARGLGLIAAAMLEGKSERVYHLASSPTNPLTFARAIDLTALSARRMHGKRGASSFERLVVKHLDAVPVHADDKPLLGVTRMKTAAKGMRDLLRKLDLERALPGAVYQRVGARLDDRVKSISMSFRNSERRLSMVEDMLRLYRPFIHDHDYIFATDHVHGLRRRLLADEAAWFDFDIDSLDWHHYWLDVHVPGLEKWCLPLLRGERVPNDPPLARRPMRERSDDQPAIDLSSMSDQPSAAGL